MASISFDTSDFSGILGHRGIVFKRGFDSYYDDQSVRLDLPSPKGYWQKSSLSYFLRKPELSDQVLHLYNIVFDDNESNDGMENLFLVSQLKNLKRLIGSVAGISMHEDFFEEVFENFSRSENLHYLHLDFTQRWKGSFFDDIDRFYNYVSVLRESKKLEYLKLEFNDFDLEDDHCKELALLYDSKSIKHLHLYLRENKIGDEGVDYLMNKIKKNNKIGSCVRSSYLDIACNRISDDKKREIEALSENLESHNIKINFFNSGRHV